MLRTYVRILPSSLSFSEWNQMVIVLYSTGPYKKIKLTEGAYRNRVNEIMSQYQYLLEHNLYRVKVDKSEYPGPPLLQNFQKSNLKWSCSLNSQYGRG